MNVRVRGIYATALTHRLVDEVQVVAASEAIRERFDEQFPARYHEVRVTDTEDRQGVGIVGRDAAVEHVLDHLRVGRDTFVWRSTLDVGGIHDGVVRETLGSGAFVDLDGGRGFLPAGEIDGSVAEDDVVRVQVSTGQPPWTDDEPVVTGTPVVDAGVVTLLRGGAPSREMDWSAVLSADPPDGWGARWTETAERATVDALEDALAAATDRARTIDETIGEAGTPDPDVAPRRITGGRETVWVWFGRESRFALDDDRRAVTTTMPGHHRIKAGTELASPGVDFAEAVCDPAGEFPFDVVARQFGPQVGDLLSLEHGKPDGRVLVLGEGEVTSVENRTATLRRDMSPGGTYDGLDIERQAGDIAVTKLREGRWWYPTVYESSDGTPRGTYVNVCTPVELFPHAARYVDLHVDVVKHRDGLVEVVDTDELDAAVDGGHVAPELADQARTVARSLEEAL